MSLGAERVRIPHAICRTEQSLIWRGRFGELKIVLASPREATELRAESRNPDAAEWWRRRHGFCGLTRLPLAPGGSLLTFNMEVLPDWHQPERPGPFLAGVESRESAAFPSGKPKMPSVFAAVCSLRGTRRAGRGPSRPARREQSAASCSGPRRQSSILDMERSGKPLRRCRESKSDRLRVFGLCAGPAIRTGPFPSGSMDERTDFTSRRQSPSFRHGMKWRVPPRSLRDGVESRSLTPFVIFGTNSPPCGGTGSQEREPSPELAALTENAWVAGVAMFSLLAEPNGGLGP